jgi:hypothetical protein
MTSSNIKSEEIYREHVANNSLFSNKSKLNVTSDQQNKQQQPLTENVSGYEEIFGPPPLSKVMDSSKPKSKVS